MFSLVDKPRNLPSAGNLRVIRALKEGIHAIKMAMQTSTEDQFRGATRNPIVLIRLVLSTRKTYIQVWSRLILERYVALIILVTQTLYSQSVEYSQYTSRPRKNTHSNPKENIKTTPHFFPHESLTLNTLGIGNINNTKSVTNLIANEI